MKQMFSINQIVKGKTAGTFVIVGFRSIEGSEWVQVKSVNPANHSQVAKGEMALPLTAIQAIS
jgi:hypothetical protein